VPQVAGSAKAKALEAELAQVSRPEGVAYRARRVGKRRGAVAKRAKNMNWFHPFIWRHIAAAARKYNFSAAAMARSLKIDDPELFLSLHKGTIQRWLRKDTDGKTEKAWKDSIVKNINAGHAVFGTGRVGVLKPYPELVNAIKGKF
jgi:hypothetical protein